MNVEEYKKMQKLSQSDTFCFRCDCCGECCRDRGDIIVNPHDMLRMRKYLGISLEELLDTYCEIYEGESSRIPIVRLRHSALCVFLMHGRCLVQEAKPSVCALYPMGRLLEEGSSEVAYFLQEVSCGAADMMNSVADWVQVLGEDHEACAGFWFTMVKEASGFARSMSGTMAPDEKGMLQGILFALLYGGYDCSAPFLAQFEAHLGNLRQFIGGAGRLLQEGAGLKEVLSGCRAFMGQLERADMHNSHAG